MTYGPAYLQVNTAPNGEVIDDRSIPCSDPSNRLLQTDVSAPEQSR